MPAILKKISGRVKPLGEARQIDLILAPLESRFRGMGARPFYGVMTPNPSARS
jgi:hypothetical protein